MTSHSITTLALFSVLAAFTALASAEMDQNSAETSPVSSASTVAERLLEIRGSGTEIRNLSLNVYGSDRFQIDVNFHGMVLPKPGINIFTQNFTVPTDHQAGTPLGIRMLWHMGGNGGSNCYISMSGNHVHILRPGSNLASGQIRFSNNQIAMPLLAPVSQSEVVETIAWIPTEVAPGDGITFSMFRDTDPQDACSGSMVIGSLSIVYQAASDGVFTDRFQSQP